MLSVASTATGMCSFIMDEYTSSKAECLGLRKHSGERDERVGQTFHHISLSRKRPRNHSDNVLWRIEILLIFEVTLMPAFGCQIPACCKAPRRSVRIVQCNYWKLCRVVRNRRLGCRVESAFGGFFGGASAKYTECAMAWL